MWVAPPAPRGGPAVSWAERSWGARPARRDEFEDDVARFQQRQLEERERRLLQLCSEQRVQAERATQRLRRQRASGGGGSSSSSSSNSQSSQASLPCGKVRQLFEGRRQQQRGVGRDRGQPLAPLGDRQARSSSNVNLSQSYHFGQPPARGHSLDRALPLQRYHQGQQGAWAGRGRRRPYDSDTSDSEEDSPSPPLYSRSFAIYDDVRLISRLPNVGGPLHSQDLQRSGDMAPPARMSAAAPSNENAPPAASKATPPVSKLPARKPTGLPTPALSRTAPLRPSSGQRSAPSAALTPPAAAARVPTSPSPRPSPRPSASPRPSPRPAQTNGVAKTVSKVPSSPQRMSSSKGGSSQPQVQARTPAKQEDGLVACSICSRRFAPDRVAKHEQICAKAGQKKRKTFDPVVARVKGTEAEKYLRHAKAAPQPKAMKSSNWRRKHEDFIQTIRAAKQVQAHVAKGGKVSDLPPPPPSDYSDYVPCPHCGRKFNQTAADRHIPKCATMLHNKPRPGAAPRPGAGGSRGVQARR